MTTQQMASRSHSQCLDVEDALRELTAIWASIVTAADNAHCRLDFIHADYQASARNLLHYLALRRHDLRPLQGQLAALGLSSLGRAESHVLATVETVLEVLHRLAGDAWNFPASAEHVDFASGQRLLAEHAAALLGPPMPGRAARIMVTMPSEAANNYALVHDLVKMGMECMRINCAHDDAAKWAQMIVHLRLAEQSLGRSCRIMMDLAGPKLRTGPLAPGPAVIRIRPQRDAFGRVTAPARIWLTGESSPLPPLLPVDASLPVPSNWLSHLRPNERVTLTDARGARRTLKIIEATDRGCWAVATQTMYVIPGTALSREPKAGKEHHRRAAVGNLPPRENAILLRPGDQLILTRDLRPGSPVTLDAKGRVRTPATIGCTLPEAFDDVRTGEAIWFDDGKIGGVIEKVEATQVLIRIMHARLQGEKLRQDKGINLPESQLQLDALTAKDIEDLQFVAQHADVIELSFANSARDVDQLMQHLARLGARRPAIVLKIETRRGFENLPDMLLTAMRAACCGVMIARGDLAIECGFERLAEVQEEILWICEAAHVPVIWATQVLETLSKEGIPSRAEITDAAMGHRAECVMLNKGPHLVSAIRALDDILRRMQTHQAKKQSMLRELRLAHALSADPAAAPGPDRSSASEHS